MPVEDGIGYGELTPIKIEHLAKIIEMHLLITQATLKKHSYYHQWYRYIDLTAGKGISPNEIKGSPQTISKFLIKRISLNKSKKISKNLKVT